MTDNAPRSIDLELASAVENHPIVTAVANLLAVLTNFFDLANFRQTPERDIVGAKLWVEAALMGIAHSFGTEARSSAEYQSLIHHDAPADLADGTTDLTAA